MKVAMIGLGKLGLPCAEVMAEQHEVSGYDIAPITSETINVKPSIKEAAEGAEIVFIAVPTPHDEAYDGSQPIRHLPNRDFNYDILKGVLKELKDLPSTTDVVLISTVLPGTIRRELVPLLGDYNFLYNPYFIAMGTVKEDFLNPEFYIIGTKTGAPSDAQRVVDFYRSLTPDPKVNIGTWTEGECVKIFYNTFISFKLSFVNMVQDVAMRLGDVDVDVVTSALCDGNYRILSKMYMKAGMGDGGPCHPRDNIALRSLSERLGLGYDLYHAVMESREMQAEGMAMYLARRGNPVCIVGKSFKPGVHLTDGSYSLLVGHFVENIGVEVVYWDQHTGDPGPQDERSWTYLLGHNTPEYHQLPFNPGSVIVDPWRACPKISGCEVIHYGNTRGQFIEPRTNTSTRRTEPELWN